MPKKGDKQAQPTVPFPPLCRYVRDRYTGDEHTLYNSDFADDDPAKVLYPRGRHTWNRMAEICGGKWSLYQAWSSDGVIPIHSADTVCAELGVHPSLIWPEWYSIEVDPMLMVSVNKRQVWRNQAKRLGRDQAEYAREQASALV